MCLARSQPSLQSKEHNLAPDRIYKSDSQCVAEQAKSGTKCYPHVSNVMDRQILKAAALATRLVEWMILQATWVWTSRGPSFPPQVRWQVAWRWTCFGGSRTIDLAEDSLGSAAAEMLSVSRLTVQPTLARALVRSIILFSPFFSALMFAVQKQQRRTPMTNLPIACLRSERFVHSIPEEVLLNQRPFLCAMSRLVSAPLLNQLFFPRETVARFLYGRAWGPHERVLRNERLSSSLKTSCSLPEKKEKSSRTPRIYKPLSILHMCKHIELPHERSPNFRVSRNWSNNKHFELKPLFLHTSKLGLRPDMRPTTSSVKTNLLGIWSRVTDLQRYDNIKKPDDMTPWLALSSSRTRLFLLLGVLLRGWPSRTPHSRSNRGEHRAAKASLI